jgi:PleD family two-component response regulator
VATFPEHGATTDALLQAADNALYKSKDAGKNKVTIFYPQPFG